MTTEDFNTELGRRLREQRHRRRLTLAELAVGCGVSLQQLQRYETGENAVSAYMLWVIASRLGLPVGEAFPAPAMLKEPVLPKA